MNKYMIETSTINASPLQQTPLSSPLSPKTGNNKKKMAIIVAFLIIAVAVIGGYFMFGKSTQSNKESGITPTEVKTLTPTEKPKIDKASVKIQVINGTGTPGQAASAVEALKKAGFSADKIKTDNAKEFKDTTTTVKVKDGFEEIAVDVQNALKSTFADIAIESTELETSSEFDVVVVTGGKKYEEKVVPTSPPTTPVATSGAATATPTLTPASTSTPTPTP